MKIWRRLPPCVHPGEAVPYRSPLVPVTIRGLIAQGYLALNIGPHQGHCNETIVGAFGEASGILICSSLGQLFWISLEAEPQAAGLYVPNQDKDSPLKAPETGIPVCQMPLAV